MKTYIRRLLILIAGVALGWAIGVFIRPETGESRDGFADASMLGVKFDFGEEAQRLAAVAGVTIPKNAIDSFYGIGGLKPVIEFVAFTLPVQEVWPFITSISGKKKSDIQALPMFQGPELFGKERHRTVLFDTSGVTSMNGVEWEIKGRVHASCVVNEFSGRIFIVITSKD
jgi:hypothetical protein